MSGSTQISNSRPFLPCVPTKIPRNLKFGMFNFSQNGNWMKKINIPWPKSHKFWRWSGHVNIPNFRAFLSCKLQIWYVSLCQNATKISKINWSWWKSNQFWRWSGYICMSKVQAIPGLTRNCRSMIYWDTPAPNCKNSNNPCDLDLWPIDTAMVRDTSSPHGVYLCHIWSSQNWWRTRHHNMPSRMEQNKISPAHPHFSLISHHLKRQWVSD